MALSEFGSGEVKKFPLSPEAQRRFARNEGYNDIEDKLNNVQSVEDFIGVLEGTYRFEDSGQIYYTEDFLLELDQLLFGLENQQKVGLSTACTLKEFPIASGIRKNIGRLLLQRGYNVHESVFADPEPPQTI